MLTPFKTTEKEDRIVGIKLSISEITRELNQIINNENKRIIDSIERRLAYISSQLDELGRED